MSSRWLGLPERHPVRTIAGIGLIFALAYTAAIVFLPKRDGRMVVGDAVYYYVYLRSAVFDRDLQFRNEFVRLYGLKGGEEGTEWVYQPTVTGHVRNMMSIGPPIVWAPLFLLVTTGVALARTLGSNYPLDGYGTLFQASAGYSGILAATIGAWLAWRLCCRFFDARTAIWSTMAVWLGSNALYYSVISPTYSHSSSILAASLFFYVWGTSFERQSLGRYALVGVLAGFCALVRWQDALLLAVPLTEIVYHAAAGVGTPGGEPGAGSAKVSRAERVGRKAQARWWPAFRNLAACGAAALVVFSPQMMIWIVLYGQPIVVPQGQGFMQWARPHLLSVLFSDWHGLFTWTPTLALGIIGVIPLWRRHRVLAVGMTAALAAFWYANAAVIDWWAGESFGARRFVSCFPVFVVGFAALIDPLKDRAGRLVALAATLISLNLLLLLQYQVFMHGWRTIAPYPRGFYGLVVARFVVPFELVARLWSR
jgi:hypothetical protein